MRRTTLIVIMMVVLISAQAESTTWHIRADGTGDVPDIWTAILAASANDTLLLADGIYTGSGNGEVSYLGMPLVVRSESGDPHKCTIDCQGSDTNWRRGFVFYRGEGPASVLEGITIKNGYGYEGGGIWCWAASPTISNVIVLDNQAVLHGGGIYCGGGAAPDLANATFYGNAADRGGAVYCARSSSPAIDCSIISYSKRGCAVISEDIASMPEFASCNIYGNAGGDWEAPILGQFGVRGNISQDPMFCLDENPGRPYSLHSSSPCAHACQPGGGFIGAVGVGCWAGVEATVDIDPDVLNPRSRKGKLTCYIELPFGPDPEAIDVSTVMLNDSIPAEDHPTCVDDYDEDGLPDRMVKFSRDVVLATLEGFGIMEIGISGMADGTAFSGIDSIRVLDKHLKTTGSDEDGEDATHLRITVSSPNHIRDGLRIEFELSEPAQVSLAIYDARGRLVRRLIDEPKAADHHWTEWDGKDASAGKVAPGIYFVHLDDGRSVTTAKITLLR
jgi:hypothetical protein